MVRGIPRVPSLAIFGIVGALLLAACGTDATPTLPPATSTPVPTATSAATPAPGQTPQAMAPTPTQAPPTQAPTATPPPAFDAAAYFKGKTIRLITSSNPGGGTDTQMRFLAGIMGKFIPGSPRIVAGNVPPHVVGKNYLYKAKGDGFTMGIFSSSMLREERFPGAEYDSTKYTYVGDIGVAVDVWTAKSDLGYKSIEDMRGASGPKLITFSDAPEPGSIEARTLGWMLMADFLNVPFELVRTAERGTGPAMLALERGDINAYPWGGGAWFLLPKQRPGWLKDGYLIPFLNTGLGGDPTPPNEELTNPQIPHIYELLTADQREQWIGLTEAPRNMERPIVMPPGVEAGVAGAIEAAFANAFKDTQFCADWERVTGAPCEWTGGEVLAKRAVDGQGAMAKWADQYDAIAEQMFAKYVR